MRRDDELYALALADAHVFRPGSHASSLHAVRALLAPGWTAEWVERGNAVRTRVGWVALRSATGEHVEARGAEYARALVTREPREAWERLLRAPGIDPDFLASLTGRLAVHGPKHALSPAEVPPTVRAALALAAAPARMREAEALVRDTFARAAPFGVGPCPAITWTTYASGTHQFVRERLALRDRGALQVLHRTTIDALGYGVWVEAGRPAQRLFSSSRLETAIPPILQWPADDMREAMQFNLARERGLVTKEGIAYAAQDNPFEPLLRIALDGFLVVQVTAGRVLLGALEE